MSCIFRNDLTPQFTEIPAFTSKSKDSDDFMKKFKEIKKVPKDAIMVTTNVIDLYPSIPHDVGLEALRRTTDDRVNKIKQSY